MKTKHLLLTAFVALFSYYAQADCRVDTIHSYKFITGNSVKVKTGRIINSYDTNNNQTQQLSQTWDGGSSSWKNSEKYDWTYDANNNRLQQIYQTWDGGSGSWENSSKHNWTYDAHNNPIQKLVQYWDGGSNSWTIFDRYNWTYDANNNKTQQLYQIWNGGTSSWIDDTKVDFTYDANNNETQRLIQLWDGGTNSWKNYFKSDYTYDANNNKTHELGQVWDGGSGSWKNESKSDYTYDAHNNQTQELRQRWDGGSNSWKNDLKYDYTYDINGCLLYKDDYRSWNTSSSNYDYHFRDEYSNTYSGNTGIAALNTSELSIYPNPVNDQLTIKTENEFENSTTTITDLFGRVVLQEKLNQSETIINTSTLNSGVYFLQISADGKSVTKKFLKN